MSRLDDLIASKNSLDREGVYASDVLASHTELLGGLRNALDEQLRLLAFKAMCEGDIFHNYRLDVAESEGLSEPVRYNTAVRLRGNSLSLDWVRYAFRKKDESGMRVFSSYVQKGAGFKVPMQRFSKAGEEEIGYIEIVESRFAQIRKATATLRKLRLALNEFEKDLAKIYD